MTIRMQLHRRLRSVRLHPISTSRREPIPPRVAWLLDLRERARRDAQVAAAVERCAASIEATVADLPDLVRSQLDEIASLATELGLALAREVVGDLVDREVTDPLASVVRCLREITHGSDRPDVRVYLAPTDVAEVAVRFSEDKALVERTRSFEFLPDESLEHGCARVETDCGRATFDPMESIDRICAEVRKEIGAA